MSKRLKRLKARKAKQGKTSGSEAPLEPKLYPQGEKLFEIQFNYGYDIAVPDAHAIVVRTMKQKEERYGSVRIERMNGSTIIDDLRITASTKTMTKSRKPLSKKASFITVGLKGGQPLHYRIAKENKIIAPMYRSAITVKVYGNGQTQTKAIKNALTIFNQFLKVYRLETGDPVPYVPDDKKSLGITFVRYYSLSPADIQKCKDIQYKLEFIDAPHHFQDGGMSAGVNTTEFDMSPKPYIKPQVIGIVRSALLPESLEMHKEPILEAIELAHRKNEYGLAIVMLNLAFEAAMTFYVLACLALMGVPQKSAIKMLNDEYRELEDKRKKYDALRDDLYDRFGLPHLKHFRGSAEEREWDKSTYKKRHAVVHITNGDGKDITLEDFKKALDDTQIAISLVAFPVKELADLPKKTSPNGT
ncbi:MAG TPA: hypothetical protein VHD60_03185 [Candidatus Saccharimonadales bacterium]|nr:hypothetical protein [Candidatus Saccharimonadales bacterium]